MTRLILLFVGASVLLAGCATPPPSGVVASTRCQTSEGSCVFACSPGSVIAASGIGAKGSGVFASCGGVTAACAGAPDCLDGGAVALAGGVGTCTVTAPSEYVDCFSLPAPVGASCSVREAYGACAFTCKEESALAAHAVAPGFGGWPRVLSVCGEGGANCQRVIKCSGYGSASRAGNGICLGRTAGTTVTCSGS